jgi:hypothetical protein
MGMYRVKNWSADEKVEDAEIAPHRYTFDSSSDYRDAEDYREFIAGVPYKVGEVVYVERYGKGCKVAKRARIVDVWFERDRYGDRRELYRAQFETEKGLWAKVAEKTYAGPIQRGYQLAGLAPDLDEADRMAAENRAKLKAKGLA